MPMTRPFGRALREDAREPARAAAGIEDVVGGRDLHELERGLGDGPMVVLHRLALAGFGPAIEFLAENLIGLRIRHSDSPGNLDYAGLPQTLQNRAEGKRMLPQRAQ